VVNVYDVKYHIKHIIFWHSIEKLVKLLTSYIYKRSQKSSRTSTFYSSQRHCFFCIPFKSIWVGIRSLVSTSKTI